MRHRSPSLVFRFTLVVAAAAALAGSAAAAPVVGFIEEWPGTSVQSWGGGAGIVNYSNPGTGGVLGSGDGYLLVSLPTLSRMGTRPNGPEYIGDWPAAGITLFKVSLNDIGNPDPLEIHCSIGNAGNLWQYNQGFVPPLDAWAPFTVDLSSSSAFTQIIGNTDETQTFELALQFADRLLIRHDRPPFVQSPDEVTGDLGIDHLCLMNAALAVPNPLEARRPLDLAPPAPNPARGPVVLAWRAFEAGATRIEIVDVTGRSVRRVDLGPAPAGAHAWLWDALDDQGRRAAPGSYRVRVSGAAGGTSRPLVVIR